MREAAVSELGSAPRLGVDSCVGLRPGRLLEHATVCMLWMEKLTTESCKQFTDWRADSDDRLKSGYQGGFNGC